MLILMNLCKSPLLQAHLTQPDTPRQGFFFYCQWVIVFIFLCLQQEEGSFRKDRGKWVMSNLHRSPFPAPLMNHCVTESHAVGFSIYWWKSLWWFEFKSLEEVTSTTLESAVTSVRAKSPSVTFVLFWKLRVMVGVFTSDNLGPGG